MPTTAMPGLTSAFIAQFAGWSFWLWRITRIAAIEEMRDTRTWPRKKNSNITYGCRWQLELRDVVKEFPRDSSF